MKLHRKWLSCLVVLAVAAICLLVLPTQAEAASASDLTFALNSDGASYSVADCDTYAGGELVIPATYNGKPVTTIGGSAFYFCKSLTNITIPDSVTTIGSSAFYYCDSLTSISIGNSVTAISNWAFAYCTSLTSITIPDSVTTIGHNAFENCTSLTSVTIGNSVTSIGYSAFNDCDSLTSITIPDSVTTIGNYAFECCYSLTSVTIPDSVTTIGDYAFFGCSLTSITIPDSVTTINSSAFYCCESLTGIWVDENNPQYSSDSYGVLFNKDKTKLAKVPGGMSGSYTIPDSVTTIGEGAFDYCASLTSITIPDSVTNIGECAFSACFSLESITVPDSVTTIGKGTFEYCTSLTSITIPDSVTTIGDYAFDGCYELNEVRYKGTEEQWNAIRIGEYNTNLTNDTIVYNYGSEHSYNAVVTAPTCTTDGYTTYTCSVCGDTYVADEVAAKGHPLKAKQVNRGSYAIEPTCTESGIKRHKYCPDCGLYFYWSASSTPANNITTKGYATLDNWYVAPLGHTYVNEVCTVCGFTTAWKYTISNGEVTITGYTGNATELTIPSTIEGLPVTAVGKSAFYYCDSLKSITIPDSVTTIGNSVFSSCDSLTGIWVDENNPQYSNDRYGVLFNKDKTELVSTPGAMSENYTIPDSVTTIGDDAFYSCDRLTSITIPDSVTTIGNYAFYNCTSLNEVRYKGTEEQWNAITIGEYNTNLTNATIVYNYGNEHSYNAVVTTPTCTAAGYTTYTCSVCGDTYVADEVAAKGHPLKVKQVIEPTCTESGIMRHKYCPDCGLYFYWSTSSTPANNITTKGYATLDNWYVAPLGHTYVNEVCTVCGFTAAWKYTISNGEVTITGYTGNATELTIPSTIERLPVTTIGDSAFYSCDSLTSITIPDSVTRIGDFAFDSCDSLTNVTIGNSVTSIGDYAFSDCHSLTNVTVGNHVSSIGYYAFSSCDSLTSIILPDSVIRIGGYAFEACKSLTSITIPDSVTRIGGYAFYNCTSLTSITIPDSVTFIGGYVFYNCTSLSNVTIGNGVTSIGLYAFYSCDRLTSVTIGNSVTSIGDYAFSGCRSLTSITIPESVTSIGSRVFQYCRSLTGITIPDGIISIDCGDYAFDGCASLTSITIPDSVTTIGDWAFSGCHSLTNITIPDSVTTIGDWAFNSCRSLTSITIPDSVTTIGNSLFSNCKSLEGIWVDENNPNYCSDSNGVLFNKDKTELVGAPGAMSENYTIPDSVTTIGDRAFYYCTSLTSITIGNSVTTIGEYAFSSCDSLINITIPDSVTTIGDSAFSSCDSLTSITIPDRVTRIGNFAFSSCTSLTSITIPDRVTRIGYDAFYNCTSLTNVTIGNRVTSIGGSAFSRCTSLTSVIYCGTQEQWNQISIGSYNEDLTAATLQFHNYEEMVLAPTCNRGGYTKSTCTFCGDSFKTDETEALGHDLEVVSVLTPTCNRGGYTTKKCTRCGGTFKTDETEALGHDLKVVSVLAPTCNRGGYTTKKCTRCGGTFKTDETEALGHDLEVVSVLTPTCNRGGYTTKKCTRCGGTFKTNETEALGHNFRERVKELQYRKSAATATSGAMFYYACADCGESSEGHTNATWEYVNTAYTSSSVARVGNKYYNSLNAAITTAGKNETVVLLKAVKEGQAINITKDITIDFGGFAYTVSEASKTGAAIVVADGVEATMTNGTVQIRYTARNDFSCLVENAGTVIASNITLKGNNVSAAGAVLVKGNAMTEGEGVSKVDPAK